MPRVRFTLSQLMVSVAVLGLGMALVRAQPALGIVYFLAALGYPVLTTADVRLSRRRLRPDARTAGLCYLAGAVGPAVCLALDPMVFQGGDEDGPMLLSVRPFCYTFMGIEMALLTFWLWLGEALGPVSGLIAGALRVGAVYAACVGLLLLPFSVLGLLVLIGALGFTPFLTAYAFYLQGRLAASRSGRPTVSRRALALQLAGASFAVGLPILVQALAR